MQSIGIIGTGLAGLRCAAELRAAGFTGTIHAWDAENREPYDRPPLSKELFGDYLHPLADDGLGDFDELAVTVTPHAATSIAADTTWRVDSQCLDALVIATGAAPRSTIAGASVLYTAADAAAISTAIVPGSIVHIVGAGWIGTEIASAAVERGAIVRVWEASPHFLNRTFHGTMDELWFQWFNEAGIEITFDTAYPGGTCDVLIQATGAHPSIDFLSFGLRSPRGALVTTLDAQVCGEDGPIAGLYAVGDCADVLTVGGWRLGGHWTQALNDPARVAAHLTGRPRPASLDAPEVFSTQFGHEITLVGEVPSGITPEYEETRRGGVWRWQLPGGHRQPELAAVLAVDSPREISRARKALRQPL